MPRVAKVRQAVYTFIESYKKANDGNSPNYEDICAAFGWKSLNNAWIHVQRLEHDGKLTFDERRRITLKGKYIPPE